ncbi:MULTISPECIES: hybrid sensor histidine kinase/response regulator [unclassified Serratia (in: enterobacteria)]|uniref:hybrid sensor histidine kinase/response regulator n=1 Tax=unclassified Serratia (in: enterobacteria) TaxID=2647522 RepID=UPI000AD06724|nr:MULTISPECIES: hybrid sensor histidine kinase/response regulator [unclassified Serratia (in: enterobacteria)]
MFGLIALALVLATGLFWGTQRIISQERGRFTLDFSTLVGYAYEQEAFLRQLRAQNSQLSYLPIPRVNSFRQVATSPEWGGRLFEGQESAVTMPFSLFCEKQADCPTAPGMLFSLGSYLADFYSSFWASSYFPAGAVFFVNESDGISINVPAVNRNTTDTAGNMQTYRAVTDAVRERLRELATKGCQQQRGDKPTDREVIWFRETALPNQMIGLIPAGFPPSIWTISHKRPTSCIYAATLLSRSRFGMLEQRVNPAPKHAFWLQRFDQVWLKHQDYGLLMGQGKAPEFEQQGVHYTLTGLVFKIIGPNSKWTGYYYVSYGSFFQDNLWLPIGVLMLLLSSILGGLAYTRWYNRRVIAPAQEAQRELLESEAFNRTLIQTAPVAVCLIARADGHLVFGNALALEWLDATAGQRLPPAAATKQLLGQVLLTRQAGTIEQLEGIDGRTLYVAYAPTRYMQRDVILCVFADVSARAEIERQLERAKSAADEASAAKSTFLATMSHEIRTPLYGALGTLELLSMTQLDRQQRQYVDRIDDASQILLQLISDILDISKIEAGQLQLETVEFNPRELVQSVTSTFAAMAYRKGLLLFSVVSIDVPCLTVGDPVRIRQILSNLVNNAIKFTDSGQVIVRLSQTAGSAAETQLRMEVCDSGIGITQAQQEKLFTPFYLTDASRGSLGGAGLGLSICKRLAGLMGAEIQLDSQPQQGSRFYLTLALAVATTTEVDEPQLRGASVWVKTPHPELTDNLCAWLQRWGAQSSPFTTSVPPGHEQDILLDIQAQRPSDPGEWPGRSLPISLSGETANYADIDAYSLSSIGFGIDRLLHGQQLSEQRETVLPQFKARVLVAEDNPLNQVTLQGQLELLGCEVTLADDGEEALALWDIAPHDLVLTDVNMPYMNGYELARSLRNEGMAIPIIGVTANAMLDEERRCVEAGMNAWLVKPIGLQTLVDLLRKFMPAEPLPAEGVANEHFEQLEPNVLDKHRDIFLKSMADDLSQLEQGMAEEEAGKVENALHRMRGALVLAQCRELAANMEALEIRMQTHGLDEQEKASLAAIMVEIRHFLASIESTV